ncbi:MAG: Sec23/Sec24 zinc finger-containing protein [Raoultibacter sp.]
MMKPTLSALGSTFGKMPSDASIPDAVSYFYIKKIKGWMECPVCGDKLLFNEVQQAWVCVNADFILPEDEFLNGYVFWFCDQCESFLNIQSGFDASRESWVCHECGYENDISSGNLVGTCQDCGALLEDPNATVCEDCEFERLKRADHQRATWGSD